MGWCQWGRLGSAWGRGLSLSLPTCSWLTCPPRCLSLTGCRFWSAWGRGKDRFLSLVVWSDLSWEELSVSSWGLETRQGLARLSRRFGISLTQAFPSWSLTGEVAPAAVHLLALAEPVPHLGSQVGRCAEQALWLKPLPCGDVWPLAGLFSPVRTLFSKGWHALLLPSSAVTCTSPFLGRSAGAVGGACTTDPVTLL